MSSDLTSLTQGLARCEEAAWREFHARYFGQLLKRVTARGVADCDAADVVQRVYLRILRHPRVCATEEAWNGWLACLVRCEVIDFSRGRQRRNWLNERFQQFQESRSTGCDNERIGELEDALGELSESDRALLAGFYRDGWSHQRLAAHLRITAKAVESKLGRLRQRLRQRLCPPGNAKGSQQL
jgi:RNA polymerase sigma factor (sigma-70 family)